ncbi:MAG: 2-oxoglutarate oxidoreductase [Caldisericaceae bacterium]|nr:2-oxoglutarate oxidoreductase [Caldisericaceae bacterium]
MKLIYKKPDAITERDTTYCPGCPHGIAHRLVAELLEEMDLVKKTVIVWPVGCSVFGYYFIATDAVEAAHGRACAMATGIKRVHPESFVMTYQGDGDLASIGIAETVHAAARGERISVVYINNGNYGMTGGQMAPTTLIGQVTTTSPYGRKPELNGFPMHVPEMLAALDGPAYIARAALDSPQHIIQAKKFLKKAFTAQVKNLGFSLVELVSACPTNWKMTPVEAMERIRKEVLPVFPIGEFKVAKGVE